MDVVNVMYGLLFVFHVWMLRGVSVTAMLVRDSVGVVAGCECMGGTRGLGVVSSADDVLEMSGVRGVRDVGEVCEISMCIAQARWEVRGFGLGFSNPVGTGGVWDMCLCCDGMGDVGGSGWTARVLVMSV